MERVTFLVEKTGHLISCMLNPETLVIKRRSGIHQRTIKSVVINADKSSDDGLIFSGGGNTVLELDLVFDISIKGSTIQSQDVRELTKPIWDLSENSTLMDGEYQPGLSRFVWGKSWNIPCVISSISERFDLFDSSGVPKRSWLRVRLIKIAQTNEQNQLINDDNYPVDDVNQEVTTMTQKSMSESDLTFNDANTGINNYLV
ncbi:MAG: hypothetical protein OQL19_01545 [Gammaproteobacteria bacterium]|nr:hypothetical protein [Gammaproteobacteria bacterium]